MTRLELIQRVRAVTRDLSNSIFREQDIVSFINEGVDRFKQYIPQLSKMNHLVETNSSPDILPSQYHHLLAVYCSSRCFSQDERHYQATTMMNEFETKLEELKAAIDSADVVIIDPETGESITEDNFVEYVTLKPYWGVERQIR